MSAFTADSLTDLGNGHVSAGASGMEGETGDGSMLERLRLARTEQNEAVSACQTLESKLLEAILKRIARLEKEVQELKTKLHHQQVSTAGATSDYEAAAQEKVEEEEEGEEEEKKVEEEDSRSDVVDDLMAKFSRVVQLGGPGPDSGAARSWPAAAEAAEAAAAAPARSDGDTRTTNGSSAPPSTPLGAGTTAGPSTSPQSGKTPRGTGNKAAGSSRKTAAQPERRLREDMADDDKLLVDFGEWIRVDPNEINDKLIQKITYRKGVYEWAAQFRGTTRKIVFYLGQAGGESDGTLLSRFLDYIVQAKNGLLWPTDEARRAHKDYKDETKTAADGVTVEGAMAASYENYIKSLPHTQEGAAPGRPPQKHFKTWLWIHLQACNFEIYYRYWAVDNPDAVEKDLMSKIDYAGCCMNNGGYRHLWLPPPPDDNAKADTFPSMMTRPPSESGDGASSNRNTYTLGHYKREEPAELFQNIVARLNGTDRDIWVWGDAKARGGDERGGGGTGSGGGSNGGGDERGGGGTGSGGSNGGATNAGAEGPAAVAAATAAATNAGGEGPAAVAAATAAATNAGAEGPAAVAAATAAATNAGAEGPAAVAATAAATNAGAEGPAAVAAATAAATNAGAEGPAAVAAATAAATNAGAEGPAAVAAATAAATNAGAEGPAAVAATAAATNAGAEGPAAVAAATAAATNTGAEAPAAVAATAAATNAGAGGAGAGSSSKRRMESVHNNNVA
ncbi:hypothetical protein PLESTM_000832600 [Pleodorina starrii]|nr:hypothetical protein PLESTM_000832600 [Pleodorina starrii]